MASSFKGLLLGLKFLCFAAPGRAFATGVQARNFDGDAGAADPAFRTEGDDRILNRADTTGVVDAGSTARALVVHPVSKTAPGRHSGEISGRSAEARLDEAVGLAKAIRLDVIRAEIASIT